jgi:hypothetical protein
MITSQSIRQRFGDLWPCHNRAFNALLVECRKAVDGDLDKVLILSIIGERSFTSQRAGGISYDQFLAGRRSGVAMRAINVQSISDYSGIPRETVRRKVEQLIARGWVARDAGGSLFVEPKAAEDLAPVTEGTFDYLEAIGTRILELFAPNRSGPDRKRR